MSLGACILKDMQKREEKKSSIKLNQDEEKKLISGRVPSGLLLANNQNLGSMMTLGHISAKGTVNLHICKGTISAELV